MFSLIPLFAACALASPSALQKRVAPVVASTTSYGNLVDTGLNRDSCSSAAWWPGTVLWTCRDTQIISAGIVQLKVVPNTASFSGMPSSPISLQPLNPISPTPFGTPFYPLQSNECPPLGNCGNGTRYVGWPDTGPVVVFDFNNGVNAYAVVARQALSGLSVLNAPDYTLYHLLSTSQTTALPSVSIDAESFWSATQIGYGSAASVVANGYAYMYGATPSKALAVARAKTDEFLGAIDSKSKYEYFVNGVWTATAPSINTPNIALANTRSVQGTIYYSNKWQAFVWIGGDGFPNAKFYVSTAPAPEGPWTAPQLFFTGAVGTGALPAYSAVAHPALTDGTGNYIFITWTKTSLDSAGSTVYTQPLVRVDWQ